MQGQGLLADDVLIVQQGVLNVLRVGIGGRADVHEVYIPAGKHRVRVRVDVYALGPGALRRGGRVGADRDHPRAFDVLVIPQVDSPHAAGADEAYPYLRAAHRNCLM